MTKLNQPCPCGSGKKYRACCAAKDAARRKLAKQSKKLLTWVGAAAVVGALAYGIARSSGVPFDEKDLTVVDFTILNSSQKKTALEAANGTRCVCGCGMTLAQCVATDSTCPLRDGNIGKIRTMVTQAKGS